MGWLDVLSTIDKKENANMISTIIRRLQACAARHQATRSATRCVTASTLAALLLGTLGLGTATESQAVPAFARQTGMACAACHFQSYPAINAFGRAFKSAGYTLIGAQEKIEGDDLSLPVVLNASLVTKFRYQKTNGDDKRVATNTGELQFPDEAALLIGGRAGEHVGFVLELATFGEADTGSGDVAGTADLVTGEVTGDADTGSGEFSLFGSFKMPITYKVGGADLSFIPFTTDAGGAGYGFELLNTGAQRFQRVGEDRSALMAQQYLGLGAGEAEGFAFVAANEMGFVNVSLWAPIHGSFAVEGLAPYVRAALTPSIGSWDTGFGFQYFSGEAEEDDGSSVTGNLVEYATEGWAIDGQMQGEVGKMPLGVYAAYGETPADPDSIFNSSVFDRTAWSIHGQLGVLPGKATLILGYRSADRGTANWEEDNALTLGGTYQLAQNVQVQLNHVERSGNRFDADNPSPPTTGDRQTTLMLFSAF
jgi:hypothetical protein